MADSKAGGDKAAPGLASDKMFLQEPHIATTDLRELMGLYKDKRDTDNTANMAVPTFAHKLPQAVKAKHYIRDVSFGEEEHVIHDMIKSCAMLERRWEATITNEHNGSSQSIIHESLARIKKAETWHLWYSELTKSVMEFFKPLATRVYTENNEENVEANKKDPIITVGTSRLHAKTQSLIHVWQSCESANLWVQAWERVWQTILEFRIEGIFAPFSAMFCFEGTYISVIALPPIRIVDREPIMVPGPDLPSTLLSYNCEQLMRGLFIPTTYRGLSLCHGIDGRYYIISMREIVTLRLPAPFNGNVVRTEALMRCMKEKKLANPGRYVSEVLVPVLVETLAAAINTLPQEERNVPGIVNGTLFKLVFHKVGVNLSQIYVVIKLATKRLEETKNPLFKLIIDAGYSEMVGRTLKGFVRADCATQIASGRDTVEDRLDVCNRVARFLMTKDMTFWTKHVVPALKLKYSITDDDDDDEQEALLGAVGGAGVGGKGSPPNLSSPTQRMSPTSPNTIGRGAAGDLANAPPPPPPKPRRPPFELPHSKVHLASALKVMSNRIGCEYSVEEGRFNKFVDITSVRMLSCKAPSWLVSEQPRTEEEQKEAVASVWREAQYSDSINVREAFTARAIVCSVLLDHEIDRARAIVTGAKEVAFGPKATLQDKLKYIRLLSLLMDFPMNKGDKMPIIFEYIEAIKTLKAPPGLKLQDLAHNTVRMIQASEAIKALGDPFPVEHIEWAMKRFVSDKFVDFTFSNIHAHALVVSEESMEEYNNDRARNYFNIIDTLRPVLRAQHKSLAETKYFTRAMAAVLDSPTVEGHVDASKEAMMCVQNQTDQYGYEDPRVALMLFTGSMFGARKMKSFDPEMMQLYEYMHEVVNQVKAAPDRDAELEIVRGGWPMTIIYRIHMYIERQKDPDMEPLKLGIEEYLRRFGRPLYAAMHIQRMGRAFSERDYCGWLRKERAARKIERVGRGYLARRLWMYRLHREKAEDMRQKFAEMVQRQGRGYLARKDLKRRQIFANLLKGAAARHRFRKMKEAAQLLQRVGRGFMGRKLMSVKVNDEADRQQEIARKEQVEKNKVRGQERIAEMEKRLREAAIQKALEVLEEEDVKRREREEAEQRIRDRMMDEEDRHRKWSDELALRNAERDRQARLDKEEEDQQLEDERRRPNLFRVRDTLFGDQNPLPSYEALLQRAAGGDGGDLLFQVTTEPTKAITNLRDEDIPASGEKLTVPPGKAQIYGRFRDNSKDQKLLKLSREGAGVRTYTIGLFPDPIVGAANNILPPPPIELGFKRTIEKGSAWGILFDEERYQRFLLTRYMMDETRELLLWLDYCYKSLLEADEEKFLEMKKNAARGVDALIIAPKNILRGGAAAAAAAVVSVSVVDTPQQHLQQQESASTNILRRDLAATTIQCAWRCNMARFELRWRVLHSSIHCRRLYKRFLSDSQQKEGILAPLSVIEKQRRAALEEEVARRLSPR